MKKIFILLLSAFIINYGISQTKTEFEKNGIKINFRTTKLYELIGNQPKLIRDMNLSGELIIIPENKSVVIRHDNGNDELLKVGNVKKTYDGNYVLDCNKNRTLLIDISEKLVIYSIMNTSTFFAFSIVENEINKLQSAIKQFNISNLQQAKAQTKVINNPLFIRRDVSYLDIVKIENEKTNTTIYFKYKAPKTYASGGWVCIKNTIFIRDKQTNKRYRLNHTNNIPLCPNKHRFDYQGQILEFSLVFDAIPASATTIDIIESETTNNDFNFYGVSLTKSYEKSSTVKLNPKKHISIITLKPNHIESGRKYGNKREPETSGKINSMTVVFSNRSVIIYDDIETASFDIVGYEWLNGNLLWIDFSSKPQEFYMVIAFDSDGLIFVNNENDPQPGEEYKSLYFRELNKNEFKYIFK